MEILTLNGTWLLLHGEAIYPARVPGCVHLDLHDSGVIDDPYYRDNESTLFWIGETAWHYQRTFAVSAEFLQHERIFLRCKGLDTLATLRLNGTEIGRADNMYRTWEFDVKPHMKTGENLIEVDFAAPMPFLRQQEAEKGVLYAWSVGDHRLNSGAWLRKEPCNFGWDWGPQLVTSGIWRDIELVAFDTARLSDLYILQHHDTGVDLTVQGALERLTELPLSVSIQVRYENEVVAEQVIQVMASAFETRLTIPTPRLWWPHGMGKQPLYHVSVQLSNDSGVLDEQVQRIGLCKLQLERHADEWGESFYFSANGVSFFAKGANWIPADTFAPRLTRQDYARLIQDSVAANMNMLRVWGGGIYEADEFYDLCDEHGICVWQDFMFACGTYPTYNEAFMRNVEAEARDNVRRIRHHPSIVLWCGNNEIEQGLVSKTWTDHTMSWEDYSKLFDVLLYDVVRELDPARPYWPGSAHSPIGDREDHMNPDCGDAHLWHVWHRREPFEWYRTCNHRFVSEFGFQSFPEPQTVYAFTLPEDRNITSYVMEHHQRSGIGNQTIIHYLLDWFQMPTSFEATLWLSQILQGMGIKYAVEHWRRNMPRSMGSLYWQLNDCWPAPSWSSIDWTGRWKALHYMSRRFYAPVLISGVEAVNNTVAVHITSDLQQAQAGIVKWTLTDAAGVSLEQGELEVTIPPNQSQQVSTLNFSAYASRNVLVWLDVVIEGAIVSDNLVMFVRPKHLPLVQPDIAVDISQCDDGAFAVMLTTQHAALWTWLETTTPARFSDNFVHLRAGRPVTVKVNVPLSQAEFQEQLVVKSLIDTYK